MFGCDTILNVKHEANWAYINEIKEKISLKNNRQENKTWKKYEYAVGDKVLLKMQTNLKYGSNAYTGLFEVTKVNDNGTVWINMGCVTNT